MEKQGRWASVVLGQVGRRWKPDFFAREECSRRLGLLLIDDSGRPNVFRFSECRTLDFTSCQQRCCLAEARFAVDYVRLLVRIDRRLGVVATGLAQQLIARLSRVGKSKGAVDPRSPTGRLDDREHCSALLGLRHRCTCHRRCSDCGGPYSHRPALVGSLYLLGTRQAFPLELSESK